MAINRIILFFYFHCWSLFYKFFIILYPSLSKLFYLVVGFLIKYSQNNFWRHWHSCRHDNQRIIQKTAWDKVNWTWGKALILSSMAYNNSSTFWIWYCRGAFFCVVRRKHSGCIMGIKPCLIQVDSQINFGLVSTISRKYSHLHTTILGICIRAFRLSAFWYLKPNCLSKLCRVYAKTHNLFQLMSLSIFHTDVNSWSSFVFIKVINSLKSSIFTNFLFLALFPPFYWFLFLLLTRSLEGHFYSTLMFSLFYLLHHIFLSLLEKYWLQFKPAHCISSEIALLHCYFIPRFYLN